ncbi:MAG: tetratricopeptide repeat protein, partial [Halobacteriovoraceae bacterium]|nr:tetratricopeptide repeat protein [Halobacteriovoraceae bacterium]
IIEEMKIKNKEGKKLPKRFYFNIATFYHHKKNWNKCIENYNIYLNEVTNDRFAHNNIAICQREIGKLDDSISNYKKALALGEFGAAKQGLALNYMQKSRDYIKQKQYDKAHEFIEQGLALFPLQQAYYNLVLINFLQGDVKKGFFNIKKYVSMSNKKIEIFDVVIKVLYSMKKTHKSIYVKTLEKVIEETDDSNIKLSSASLIILDVFEKEDYSVEKTSKAEKAFSIIQKMEKENIDLIKENKNNMREFTLSCFYMAIIKNDIDLYEKAVKLINELEGEQQDGKKFIADMKKNIMIIDHNIGREPASFVWKVKKKLHIFLQKNLEIDFVNFNPRSR